MSVARPKKLKIPMITRESGMIAAVARVMSRPQPLRISPLFTGRRPRQKHMPDKQIKVQQMLCCHRYPGSSRNQGIFI